MAWLATKKVRTLALTLESLAYLHVDPGGPITVAHIDHNDVARRYQNPIVDRVDELAGLRERLPCRGGKKLLRGPAGRTRHWQEPSCDSRDGRRIGIGREMLRLSWRRTGPDQTF